MNDRIPKMNFGGRKVEYGGDAEDDEAERLEVRKGSPLKIMISPNEEGRRSETCVESRKWPIIWTMNKLA